MFSKSWRHLSFSTLDSCSKHYPGHRHSAVQPVLFHILNISVSTNQWFHTSTIRFTRCSHLCMAWISLPEVLDCRFGYHWSLRTWILLSWCKTVPRIRVRLSILNVIVLCHSTNKIIVAGEFTRKSVPTLKFEVSVQYQFWITLCNPLTPEFKTCIAGTKSS